MYKNCFLQESLRNIFFTGLHTNMFIIVKIPMKDRRFVYNQKSTVYTAVFCK